MKHSMTWAGVLIGGGLILILAGGILDAFWLVLVGIGAACFGISAALKP